MEAGFETHGQRDRAKIIFSNRGGNGPLHAWVGPAVGLGVGGAGPVAREDASCKQETTILREGLRQSRRSITGWAELPYEVADFSTGEHASRHRGVNSMLADPQKRLAPQIRQCDRAVSPPRV